MSDANKDILTIRRLVQSRHVSRAALLREYANVVERKLGLALAAQLQTLHELAADHRKQIRYDQ